MASLPENLEDLQLSADEVKRQNPDWSDEMVRDYLAKGLDIRSVAEEVSRIVFPAIISNLSKSESLPTEKQMQPSATEPAFISPYFPNTQEEPGGTYGKLVLGSYQQAITTATPTQITGFTFSGRGVSGDSSSLKVVEQGAVQVTIYAEVDATNYEPVEFWVYKNGAKFESMNVIPEGAALLSNDHKVKCLTFSDYGKSADKYELYVEQNSAFDVTVDIKNIIFSMVQ